MEFFSVDFDFPISFRSRSRRQVRVKRIKSAIVAQIVVRNLRNMAMKKSALWSPFWIHSFIESPLWPLHSCPKFWLSCQSKRKTNSPQLMHSYTGYFSFFFGNNFRFASHVKFPWQYENPTHLPGGSQSVAHQFIRCVLHQLAPNGIFVQMFLTQMKGIADKP